MAIFRKCSKLIFGIVFGESGETQICRNGGSVSEGWGGYFQKTLNRLPESLPVISLANIGSKSLSPVISVANIGSKSLCRSSVWLT
jgi:hypothetical protein